MIDTKRFNRLSLSSADTEVMRQIMSTSVSYTEATRILNRQPNSFVGGDRRRMARLADLLGAASPSIFDLNRAQRIVNQLHVPAKLKRALSLHVQGILNSIVVHEFTVTPETYAVPPITNRGYASGNGIYTAAGGSITNDTVSIGDNPAAVMEDVAAFQLSPPNPSFPNNIAVTFSHAGGSAVEVGRTLGLTVDSIEYTLTVAEQVPIDPNDLTIAALAEEAPTEVVTAYFLANEDSPVPLTLRYFN